MEKHWNQGDWVKEFQRLSKMRGLRFNGLRVQVEHGDRVVDILNARFAGAGPTGACPGLATSFAPEHRLLSGDLWLSAGP